MAVREVFPARAGKSGKLGTLAESSGVVEIQKTATRPDAALDQLLRDGDGPFLPVNQVGAFKMPPVHVAPENTERIVLVVEVIDTVCKNHAVRVIVPATAGRGMELIAVRLGVVGG